MLTWTARILLATTVLPRSKKVGSLEAAPATLEAPSVPAEGHIEAVYKPATAAQVPIGAAQPCCWQLILQLKVHWKTTAVQGLSRQAIFSSLITDASVKPVLSPAQAQGLQLHAANCESGLEA